MRKIKLQKLSCEAFAKYGAYANLIDPQACKLGEEPSEFFRDMVRFSGVPDKTTTFSVSRVCKRPWLIDCIEYHTDTGEGMLPIDGDTVMYFAPATGNGDIPLDRFEAFLVPKGTVVSIYPGVWHCGAFPYNSDRVNVLIVLPERTYANDCAFHKLSAQDQIEIVE